MCRVVEKEIFEKHEHLPNHQSDWFTILERTAIYQTLVSAGHGGQD